MSLSAKEVAKEFGTDARTLRKFLRDGDASGKTETPGQGGRWNLEKKELKALRKKFDAWHTTKPTKNSKPKAQEEDLVEEIDDDLEEVEEDELDDDEFEEEDDDVEEI